MDLSGLSDADVQALASGDMSKLSDEALSHIAGGGGEKPVIHGGEGDTRPLMEKLKDPEIYKKIAFGDPKSNVVEGEVPLVMPMGAAPKALTGLAEFLGKNIATRTAGGALQGAATKALANVMHHQDAGEGVGTAAALGGGLNLAGEAISSLPQAGKYFSKKMARMSGPQADAYVQDPSGVGEMAKQLDDPSQMPGLQNEASEAINNSRRALKTQGLGNAGTLRELLEGKSVSIDPSQYEKLDPRIDEVLNKARGQVTQSPEEAFKSMASRGPESLNIPANDMNAIKRVLQEKAAYPQGTVLDPVTKAKYDQFGGKATQARQALEGVGGDDVAALNKKMQESMLLQEALRRGGKSSPLAFVSSESPDRIATLARAENNGGGGLLDFGNKFGAAKTMQQKDVGSGVPTFLGKMAGRLGLRLSNALQTPAEMAALPGANPLARQFLLNKLVEPEDK